MLRGRLGADRLGLRGLPGPRPGRPTFSAGIMAPRRGDLSEGSHDGCRPVRYYLWDMLLLEAHCAMVPEAEGAVVAGV